MSTTGPLGTAKVIESTVSAPGTGTFTLGGAFGLGSQTFVAAVGSGNIALYIAEDADGSNWEEGFGTVNSGVPDDTLTRTFVFASSNGGAKVNFTTAPTVFIGSLGGGPGNSVLSGHKGSTRPAWLQAGDRWIDDTNDPVWTINLFDGDEDIAVADFDTTTGRFSLRAMLGDIEVESTDAGAGAGPAVTLYRNSTSPAANDLLGQLKFRGKSSTAVDRLYALLHAQLLDPTNAAEDGQFVFQALVAGAMTTILTAGANGVGFSRIAKFAKGADLGDADIAAGILTLGGDGNSFDFAGTEALTGIATVGVGTLARLVHTSARTLTHHATDLILPGGANITTAAGDVSEWLEYAAGDWRCVDYQKASGEPIANGVDVARLASGWVIFQGTGTVAVQDSENVLSVTDAGTGTYTVNWDGDFTSQEYPVSINVEHPSAASDAFMGQVDQSGQAAGSLTISTTATTNAVATDVPRVHVLAFGDLA